jgi:hypothetical protein
MSRYGKVAVLMGGRAGLGAAVRLVRAGALGRPIEAAWAGVGA